RRRHTRCYRDWSSDVCSSDLRRSRLRRARSADQAGEVGSLMATITTSPTQQRAIEMNVLARKQRSLWGDAFWRLRRNKAAMVGQIGRASCRERGEARVGGGEV